MFASKVHQSGQIYLSFLLLMQSRQNRKHKEKCKKLFFNKYENKEHVRTLTHSSSQQIENRSPIRSLDKKKFQFIAMLQLW